MKSFVTALFLFILSLLTLPSGSQAQTQAAIQVDSLDTDSNSMDDHVRRVRVPFAMSTECQYTHSVAGQVDEACTGCRWAAGLFQQPQQSTGAACS